MTVRLDLTAHVTITRRWLMVLAVVTRLPIPTGWYIRVTYSMDETK